MKRIITILLTAFMLGFPLYGQNLELTLETTPGNLHIILNEEQQKNVTSLTITGSMNNSDFYFIRDKLLKLEFLDLRKVDTDTIPDKAFLYSRKRTLNSIYIPISVKYIGNEAFFDERVFISGDFPKLGSRSFIGVKFTITEDNKYLKKDAGAIYSADGKTLFFLNDYDYFLDYESRTWTIHEGTEIIANRAFDNCTIFRINFPASLKLIEKHAFKNSDELLLTSWPYVPDCMLIFESTQPPVLAKNVFSENPMFGSFCLIIPEGATENYLQEDEQWSIFYIAHSNIDSQKPDNLKISRNGNMLCIESEKEIANVSILSMQGHPVCSSNGDKNQIDIPVQTTGVYLLKVIYTNGTNEIKKVLL